MEFRELITSFMEHNNEIYLDFIDEKDINIKLEDINNDEMVKKKEFLKKYIDNAKNNGIYAGDLEISTACILFACNIRIYIQNYGYYKLYNEFNPQFKNNKHIDSDIINILFINNNLFNC